MTTAYAVQISGVTEKQFRREIAAELRGLAAPPEFFTATAVTFGDEITTDTGDGAMEGRWLLYEGASTCTLTLPANCTPQAVKFTWYGVGTIAWTAGSGLPAANIKVVYSTDDRIGQQYTSVIVSCVRDSGFAEYLIEGSTGPVPA